MYPPNGARPDDMDHVLDGIWLGSHYVLKSANVLNSKGIKHVINTAIEFITEDPHLVNWEDLQRNGIEVHNTYWDDTMTQPIFPSASLEIAVKKMDEVLRSGKPILVNCAMGKSRSTSLVCAYLMARRGMTFDQALAQCKKVRPQVQPNQNFERQLRQLEASLRSAFAANGQGSHDSVPNTPLSPSSIPPSTAPLSPRMMSMMRPNSPPTSPNSNTMMGSVSPLSRSMSPNGRAPFSPPPPSPGTSARVPPPSPSTLQNRTPTSPSYGNGLNSMGGINGVNGFNNNGYNPMNNFNGNGYNSMIGPHTGGYGMNSSGSYSNLNSALSSPRGHGPASVMNNMNNMNNNKLNNPYSNFSAPKNNYGLQSPYSGGNGGYGGYNPYGNGHNNDMGSWGNRNMGSSPLRRRLSI